MKKITDYSQFKTILPYASEIFGVYQPLIGWKSKRTLDWIQKGRLTEQQILIAELARYFRGLSDISFDANHRAQLVRLDLGELAGPKFAPQFGSVLLNAVAEKLRDQPLPEGSEWLEHINPDALTTVLRDQVFPHYRDLATQQIQTHFENQKKQPGETDAQFALRTERELNDIKNRTARTLSDESALAGALNELARREKFTQIAQLFYVNPEFDAKKHLKMLADALDENRFKDPFLTFDPQKDIKDVSLSPLGIVHLFRQYFFEFDTFLGTPTGHVWLSPGSAVELVEVSTRRVLTEKTFETTFESIMKSERSATEQDELSEAVKQENRDDTKSGITATVTQSWVSGSASATASLNMDRTQQVAREQTHKRMREQTEKLSSEIRQNYKSTFKTVTEVTDTSSKRYSLTNTTKDLINYEMRRKMRQVGVQVQDIGTYLCWQTFVDEPGQALGLGQLVHLATPADLTPQPNSKYVDYPPEPVFKSFEADAAWTFGDEFHRFNDPALGFFELTEIPLPVKPDEGYEVAYPDAHVDLGVMRYSGEGADDQRLLLRGKLKGSDRIKIGIVCAPDGYAWDSRIDFHVTGTIEYKVTKAKKDEIDKVNAATASARELANRENERKQKEAFVKTARERIKLASNIKPRKFEELREEERTIVYRSLIRSLMSDQLYNLPDTASNYETRHVLSELINSIFDVDKMLYFVAPEWWKPRKHFRQAIGGPPGKESVVNWSEQSERPDPLRISVASNPGVFKKPSTAPAWSDQVVRQDNYYLTEDSAPARLGSSLGWLLQLDGDNHRNAFLNAPWVKAVIPVRPGKERAAINWLQNVKVEGVDGLGHTYAASPAELTQIRAQLLAADPADPVGEHPEVTISDAIRFLCLQVAKKHEESLKVDQYPKGAEIHDDNKVSSTPIEKVYEHGFYPLQGGFRVNPGNPDPNNPDQNFQVFDQWVEVLPTDQVVPVEVKYDPKTGRQL